MGSKGSDRVRSDDRFDLDKGSRVMNDGSIIIWPYGPEEKVTGIWLD